MGIRPEDLYLSVGAEASEYCFSAVVDVVEPLGSEILLGLSAGGIPLVARIDPKLRVKAGESVRLRVDADHLQFFDINSEVAI